MTKTASGYAFSWLHVANGVIVDQKNCIVDLHGFNWAGIEFNNGVGGGQHSRLNQQNLSWFSQNFHVNFWRIGLNAVWWNQNVYVPNVGMSYRDWVKQFVGWIEQQGSYIELMKGPQFPVPPCGGNVSYCAPQDQGKLDVQANPGDPNVQREVTTGRYIDQAVQMWTSLAQVFANDPAVLYGSWNEMHNIDAQTWQQSENTLIATIRAQNPRSLIFLGGPDYQDSITPLVSGEVPNFTQQNLVYDFHTYDGFNGTYNGKHCQEPYGYLWKDWPQHADEQVSWAQQHGDAVAITEWGGCNDLPDYHQAITTYARAHHIGLAYYDEANVFNLMNGQFQLNDNGARVQTAYASY